MKKGMISHEGVDMLAQWVCHHLAIEMTAKEFVLGILVIMDDEVRRAVERERQRWSKRMENPCPQ